MRFVETLIWTDVLNCFARKEEFIYGSKSLSARVIIHFLGICKISPSLTQLDFGQIKNIGDIRRRSYRAAEIYMDKMPGMSWAETLSLKLNFDVWLCFKKFIFDHNYLKFQFIEIALRFAQENPNRRISLRIESSNFNYRKNLLIKKFDLTYSNKSEKLNFLLIIFLPIFVEIFALKKISKNEYNFDNCIVCEVDGPQTIGMFKKIFKDIPSEKLFFVCEPRSLSALDGEKVIPLLLRKKDLTFLRKTVWIFLLRSFLSFSEMSSYGNLLFRFFYIVMQGKTEAISGERNLYCTYEHLTTYKAIRNSYLQFNDNISLFFPLNAHVTPQYFHSEILLNYDVVCAAGPHVEVLYRKKRALTKYFLATGSFESHIFKDSAIVGNVRKKELGKYKGIKTTILIVSPGICDATYQIELKLMELARYLASIDGVSVIIRLKPVQPIEKYRNFYKEQVEKIPQIVVTAGEYQLFDFHGEVDLVLTTISNGGFDLAQAGCEVMFIDFLGDKEFNMPWLMVPDSLVSSEHSSKFLLNWVEDQCNSRAKWHAISTKLTNAISYRHDNFESFRNNFMNQILPWIPSNIKMQHQTRK
jgi:hypothetical protein